jgi:hypothetical protein
MISFAGARRAVPLPFVGKIGTLPIFPIFIPSLSGLAQKNRKCPYLSLGANLVFALAR